MRRDPRTSRPRGRFPNCPHLVTGTNGIPHELLVYVHELQTGQPRTADVQRAITPLIQHVPSHLQPERIGRTRSEWGGSRPRAGSSVRCGPPEPCETRRQASADPLVWAQLLAVSARRSPVNQGPASRRKGEVWGHGPVCSQRKADSIRLFPVSFISARCQRPTSGRRRPWATRRGMTCVCGRSHVLHRPAALRCRLFWPDRERLNISHLRWMARWACTRAGRGDRI